MSEQRELERAYIGCVLLDPSKLDESRVVPAAIWHEPERDLYRAMVAQWEAHQDVELFSVTERTEMGQAKAMALYGEIMANAISATYLDGYARRLRAAHLRRSIHGQAKQLVQMCERKAELQKITDQIRLMHEMSSDDDAPDLVPIKVAAMDTVARIESAAQGLEAPGLPSPTLTGNEPILGPYKGGQLVVIAGRPGMGKTSLALNEACDLARNGASGLIVSLEMSAAELIERELSRQAQLSTGDMRAMTGDDQWRRFFAGVKQVANLPAWINTDYRDVTMSRVASWVRRLQRTQDIKWVVIDYLTRLKMPRAHSDASAIGEVTRQAKTLAMDSGVTVFLLAQLNRKVEERSDRRPRLSDLKASGNIEEDADVVILMHRPGYYPDLDAPEYEATAIVAKQRGGKTGDIPLTWDGNTTSFRRHDD